MLLVDTDPVHAWFAQRSEGIVLTTLGAHLGLSFFWWPNKSTDFADRTVLTFSLKNLSPEILNKNSRFPRPLALEGSI